MGRVKGWISNAIHHVDKTRPNLLRGLFWCMTQIEIQKLICDSGPHYKPGFSPTMTVSVLLGEIGHHFS